MAYPSGGPAGVPAQSSSAAAPAPHPFQDKGIAALAAAAGTEDSVERGKGLAVLMVVVGFVGAMGVAARPLYTRAFAARAATEAAAASAARAARTAENSDRVQVLLARLDTLQARHRARHPMWYGEVDAGAAAAGVGAGVGGGSGSAADGSTALR
jgi:hypothetical protein